MLLLFASIVKNWESLGPLKKSITLSVEELAHNARFATTLSYPKLDNAELRKRLKELQKLGVTALEFTGEKHVSDVNVLGKGCVGIVLVAYAGKRKMALKVRRTDADRPRMAHEAEMLEKANSVNVGPKLFGYTSNLLSMQFVEGALLPEWLLKRAGKARVRRVLRGILEQCWLLDKVGLDHGELSHAPKHIIINKIDRPFIVDFETASLTRVPANVTSVCNFLFFSGVAGEVAKRIGKGDKPGIINALKRYKKRGDRASFGSVLKACGLYTT